MDPDKDARMKIKDVEFFYLDVPMKPVPQRNMERTLRSWSVFQICRIELDNGLVGIGETLPSYTWSSVAGGVAEKLKGRSPFDFLWDDRLGAGVQMALFDAAGKVAGVPAHRLMGPVHRHWCPISWWAIDMPPQDYAAETRQAMAMGYTSMKQKPRPWFDVYEQVRQTAACATENFKIDLDFNAHLIDAANATGVLTQLEQCTQVAMIESPIPQEDVSGNRRIRRQTRCPIAMHFGNPPFPTAVREEICDGFVISGGATTCLRQFACAAQFNMPGWLQLVGTGITTTWALHLGAVASHARWPMITCMNMYESQLISDPIEVRGGFARVPDKPGLGIAFDESSLRWKVESAEKPCPAALYALVRDGGQKIWFAPEYADKGYWTESLRGNFPGVFEHGVHLERWLDDGSGDWQDLHRRLKHAVVHSRP